MGIITPAPTVLGGVSLTSAVEMVCLAHLIFCISIIANVDSSGPITLSGVLISPFTQCWTAAYFLLGIPIIVCGGIGALYRIESHLTVYSYYLVGTVIVLCVWVAIFTRFIGSCSESANGHAAIACGVFNIMVVFWTVALIGGVMIATYLVWSHKDYIRKRLETELIRYQEPWQMVAAMADDVAAEEAREINLANPKVTGASMPAVLAQEPYKGWEMAAARAFN
eukprot:TRINITY_DN51993_c0_g1_i1.p1 TRINITY_DN51993_c0_g1~~TRINITY_DN51993_c0_g1_i1.p1  ORF type:complete len:224 (-),score=27.33 TRINITY_DN51993_c0_g1_i1:95-766(-)